MQVQVRKWNRRPIAKPGIYAEMPLASYHAANACVEVSISSSGLRKIATKSPKHYWVESVYNPDALESDESEALILGRAAHHLICGQDDFKSQFAVRPEEMGGKKWQYADREAKKIWTAKREQEGRTIITQAQLDKIEGIAESLAADPAVRAGCLNGRVEESYFAKDKTTGIWLKSRPDVNPAADLSFVDLKLTRSTDWSHLQRALNEFGYYQQAALTATLCEMVYGRPMDSFSFLFVENVPPFDIEFVMLKEAEIVRGKKVNRMALERFAECWAQKKWPGRRGDRAEPRWIELKKWDQDSIDAEVKGDGA